MEAHDLIRGDRVFIDGRWRKVFRARSMRDDTVSVQTFWDVIRNWSWTFDPCDELPTKPRRSRHNTP